MIDLITITEASKILGITRSRYGWLREQGITPPKIKIGDNKHQSNAHLYDKRAVEECKEAVKSHKKYKEIPKKEKERRKEQQKQRKTSENKGAWNYDFANKLLNKRGK